MSDQLTPEQIDALMLPSPGLSYIDPEGDMLRVLSVEREGDRHWVRFANGDSAEGRWPLLIFIRHSTIV